MARRQAEGVKLSAMRRVGFLVLLGLLFAAPAHAAQFDVGAAVETINPTYPVYMGGYGGGPAGGTVERHVNPLTGRAEDFTTRAIAIRSGSRVVEIATVDTQGYFAGYQEGPYGIEDVRNTVAAFLRSHGAPDASAANVVVASLHVHAGPTLLGIWGPAAQQLPYLRQVASALTRALEEAYVRARPATITWGRADAPWVAALTIAEGNAFEGWPRDGSLGALWARDLRTSKTIATYVTQPGYPNIVDGPADLVGSRAVLSSDFPPYLDDYIERRLGGVAVVTDGTLGNQTSPEQTDNLPSPDLPRVHGLAQTRGFDDIIHVGELIGNLTLSALGAGHRVTGRTAASADQYLLAPVTNPILAADDEVAPMQGGMLWHAIHADSVVYPADRAFNPPYGDGAALGTWVTSLRIGDLLFVTMPGEFFPSIHDTWNRAIHGAAGVFVIGAAQDFLGYDYPAYAYPFTFEGSDEGFFNPSLTLGDQVVTAGEQEARALGFQAATTSTAELTALESNYARAVRPGVQLMPFPQSGDLDPRTHAFAPVIEGFSEPPRVSPYAPCGPVNPTSGVVPCPLPLEKMGPFRWSFGDGTTATTAPAGYARAYFSPFIRHSYCRAGVYSVTVSATDAHGNAESMTLPITVHPALRVRIVRRRHRYYARVSGGSGSILAYRWRLRGGRLAYTASVPVSRAGRHPQVTVVDSTGTLAATVPLRHPPEPGPAAAACS